METAGAKTEEMYSMDSTDFVFKIFKGAGKVGGYINNILDNTIYYTGKYVAFVRSLCSVAKDSPNEEKSGEGRLTIMRLVRSGAVIDEDAKKDFYTNFGRDMVAVTKSGLESENLTIIDLSKYEM